MKTDVKYVPKKDQAYAISEHAASGIYFEQCPDPLSRRTRPHYAEKSLTPILLFHVIISPP